MQTPGLSRRSWSRELSGRDKLVWTDNPADLSTETSPSRFCWQGAGHSVTCIGIG